MIYFFKCQPRNRISDPTFRGKKRKDLLIHFCFIHEIIDVGFLSFCGQSCPCNTCLCTFFLLRRKECTYIHNMFLLANAFPKYWHRLVLCAASVSCIKILKATSKSGSKCLRCFVHAWGMRTIMTSDPKVTKFSHTLIYEIFFHENHMWWFFNFCMKFRSRLAIFILFSSPHKQPLTPSVPSANSLQTLLLLFFSHFLHTYLIFFLIVHSCVLVRLILLQTTRCWVSFNRKAFLKWLKPMHGGGGGCS